MPPTATTHLGCLPYARTCARIQDSNSPVRKAVLPRCEGTRAHLVTSQSHHTLSASLGLGFQLQEQGFSQHPGAPAHGPLQVQSQRALMSDGTPEFSKPHTEQVFNAGWGRVPRALLGVCLSAWLNFYSLPKKFFGRKGKCSYIRIYFITPHL